MIRSLAAIANDNRFAILLALQKKALNVSELCELLELEQSHVSHSLQRLVAERLVDVKAEGAYRIYAIRSQSVAEFLDQVSDFLEQVENEEASALSIEREKRKAIAAALRERETELASILDHAPITLSVVDRSGTYLAVAGDIVRRFGQEAQLVGKNVRDIYPEHSLVRDNMERALAGEEVRWTLTTSGYTFETFSLPLKDAAGSVDRVLSVTVNATDWLRVKKPGLTLEDLQYLTDEAPGLRLFVDRNESITWINHFGPRAVPMASVGSNVFAAFPSLKEQGIDVVLRDVLNSGERRQTDVTLRELGDEDARHLLRLAPVWQHGHVYAVALFFLPGNERQTGV